MGNIEQAKVQHMQERINHLEKENRYLKDLLDRAGISYEQTRACLKVKKCTKHMFLPRIL